MHCTQYPLLLNMRRQQAQLWEHEEDTSCQDSVATLPHESGALTCTQYSFSSCSLILLLAVDTTTDAAAAAASVAAAATISAARWKGSLVPPMLVEAGAVLAGVCHDCRYAFDLSLPACHVVLDGWHSAQYNIVIVSNMRYWYYSKCHSVCCDVDWRPFLHLCFGLIA